jgi:hypothetical protein
MTDDQLKRRYITNELESGLRALQTVKTFDYDGAYRAAFGGGCVLSPAYSDSAAEWFEGRCRALALKTRLWSEYSDEVVARMERRG